jgi:thiamine pyrophosphokinase
MSLFSILAAGDLAVTDRLRRQIAGARVIAADSGIRHADMLGIEPELWVGDFDSSKEGDRARWPDVPRLTYPSDKAKTDTELAIEAARARGATTLLLAGAFGGARADHEFHHMTMAIRYAEAGIDMLLTSGGEEGRAIIAGFARPALPPGTEFSLLAFTGLTGLSISGAKWPLANRDVAFGDTLTLSNVATGNVEIRLGAGRAFLLAHPR